MHDLIHVIEAPAGLPVNVDFINFEAVKAGALKNYDVVINAGRAGSAWSGGDVWREEAVVEMLNRWVYEGGVFMRINEPSAVEGFSNYFRLAEVLGVGKDTGAKVCHGRWQFETEEMPGLLPEGYFVPQKSGMFLTDGTAKVPASCLWIRRYQIFFQNLGICSGIRKVKRLRSAVRFMMI